MKTLVIPLPPSFQGEESSGCGPTLMGQGQMGAGDTDGGAGDTDGGAGDTFGGAGNSREGVQSMRSRSSETDLVPSSQAQPQRDPGLAAGRPSAAEPSGKLFSRKDGPQLAWGPSTHHSVCPSQQLSSPSVAFVPRTGLLIFVVQRPLG